MLAGTGQFYTSLEARDRSQASLPGQSRLNAARENPERPGRRSLCWQSSFPRRRESIGRSAEKRTGRRRL